MLNFTIQGSALNNISALHFAATAAQNWEQQMVDDAARHTDGNIRPVIHNTVVATYPLTAGPGVSYTLTIVYSLED